jgi:hypothetical protein
MQTVEVQKWKQIVKDRSGRVLAEREVSLPPNVSAVSQEAARFLQYIVQNKGDLKISVETALQSVRDWVAALLKRMDSSRDQDEIRSLREPMSIAVALASYLEHIPMKSMTVGEFVAEALEEEAAKMPAAWKEQADSLRRAAQNEREHGGNRIVRVWDVPSEDSNSL